MGNFVEYIIGLRDNFSAAAERIGASSKKSAEAINAMGASANATEGRMAGLAASMGRVTAAQEAMNRKRLEGTRAAEMHFAAQNRIEKQQLSMLERYQAKQGLIEKGLIPAGGSGGTSVGSKLMNAYFGMAIAGMVAHGVDSVYKTANQPVMAKTKMKMVGFDDVLMIEADSKVKQLASKFRNLSKGDIYEQLYEGVSIYGNAQHALENVDSQVKLASFLQAFEGGKHSGNSGAWSREVNAWVKSMEMKGVLNEHDPVKMQAEVDRYIGTGIAMKALYGDQAKLSEYKVAQQRAGASFYRLGEDFRFNYLPAIIQEKGGPTAGTQLATGYQTVVGGRVIKKNAAKMMKKYGFMGKDGRWTSDIQDKYKDNPFLAAEAMIAQIAKVEKLNKSDPVQLEKLKDIAAKSLSWLFPDRNAADQFMNMMMNDTNLKKHAESMRRVQEELARVAKGEFFAAETYEGAKASVAKKWDDFVAGAVGGKGVKNMIQNLNWLSQGLDWAANAMARHPVRTQWIERAAAGLIALRLAMWGLRASGLVGLAGMAAGLGGFIMRAAGLAAVAGSMSKIAMAGRLLMGLTGIGAALAIGYGIYANWDKLSGAMSKVWDASKKLASGDASGVKAILKSMGDSAREASAEFHKLIGAKTQALAQAPVTNAKSQVNSAKEWIKSLWGGGTQSGMKGLGSYAPHYSATKNRLSAAGNAHAAVAAAKQRITAEVKVRTEVGPITINPSTINVKVTGQINGPVQGAGSGPISATAPRGRATAEPAAPKVSQ